MSDESKKSISEVEAGALETLNAAQTRDELEQWRAEYLGDGGIIESMRLNTAETDQLDALKEHLVQSLEDRVGAMNAARSEEHQDYKGDDQQ